MLVSTLISPMLPVLKPADTVGKALLWMEEFDVMQLPLVGGGEYLGMMSRDVLENSPDDEIFLESVLPENSNVFLVAYQHIYEALSLFRRNELDVLAVVDEEQVFIGSLQRREVLDTLGDMLGGAEKGAIVVLKLDQRDYSLAEISRLIEMDGVKIISSFYASKNEFTENEQSVLTLKLNRTEITAVVATLERFGYQILEIHANDPIETIDRERLGLLMRYLET